MLRAGVDVNHRDRSGYTCLLAACASSVTHGEDDKRAIAVKWLLKRGANPDGQFKNKLINPTKVLTCLLVCANAGFSARMNARRRFLAHVIFFLSYEIYTPFSCADSKVMTGLIEQEDVRRSKLPPHCHYCLYIPTDQVQSGSGSVNQEPVAQEGPPKRLLTCSVCHKVTCEYSYVRRYGTEPNWGNVDCNAKCQKNDWKHHKKFGCKLVTQKSC